MSSELHKYIEDAVKKKASLFDTEVLEFPKDKKIKVSKNFELNHNNYWKIDDSSNDDQLKAIEAFEKKQTKLTQKFKDRDVISLSYDDSYAIACKTRPSNNNR